MTSFLALASNLGPSREVVNSTPTARGSSPLLSKITLVTVAEVQTLKFGRLSTSGVRYEFSAVTRRPLGSTKLTDGKISKVSRTNK